MTSTTDKQATTEHLIRALYAAKAEFKDAASELKAARDKRATEEKRYDAAEKAYNVISSACQKLAII